MFVVLICFLCQIQDGKPLELMDISIHLWKNLNFKKKEHAFFYFKIVYVSPHHMKMYQLAYSGIES